MFRAKFRSTVTILASVALSAPLVAQEQRINLDPGLWEYSITLNVPPRGIVAQETQRFCIDAATANMSADEMVRQLSEDQCRATNAILTAGSGTVQMSCVYPENNARGDGEASASYTTTSYNIRANMRFVGPGGTTNAQFTGNARRIGNCQ